MSTDDYNVMSDWFKKTDQKELILDRTKKMISTGQFKEAAECFRFLMFDDSCDKQDVKVIIDFIDKLPYRKKIPAARMIRWFILTNAKNYNRGERNKKRWMLLQRFAGYVVDQTVKYTLPYEIEELKKREPFRNNVDFIVMFFSIFITLGGLMYFSVLTVTQAFAGIIMLQGFYQLIQYSIGRALGSLSLLLMLAIISFATVGCLLTKPIVGAIPLHIILAAFFLLTGGLRLKLAFNLQFSQVWNWVLFSSIMTLVLGLFTMTGFLQNNLWALGALLLLEVSNGSFAMRMLAMEAKQVDETKSNDLPHITHMQNQLT